MSQDSPFQAMLADLYFRGRTADLQRDLIFEELSALREVAQAAATLHEYLRTNIGPTDDFPVRLQTDNEDSGQEVLAFLNRLREALLHVPEPERRVIIPGEEAVSDTPPPNA